LPEWLDRGLEVLREAGIDPETFAPVSAAS
jgi:hypothetical protein